MSYIGLLYFINMIPEEQSDFIGSDGYTLLDSDFPVWRLEHKFAPTMRIFKCSEDSYRTIKQGEWPTVFDSPLFTIVNTELKNCLEALVPEQIRFQSVLIYDPPADSNNSCYNRVIWAPQVKINKFQCDEYGPGSYNQQLRTSLCKPVRTFSESARLEVIDL